ncbi:PaaI family thioesterase [Williamsia sp. DF01-3]|uniref:PaaI family thioesterase n=1 Tax=Williamsia sp. DF01-3 TaxID=2934157 RepID=UPI001FF466B4|nr:hotdog fold thioesterase [Williamsia sp. DF01-3]MCK0516672.1 hotdog fold thioesterase [Williamsia sp. DF01-3]
MERVSVRPEADADGWTLTPLADPILNNDLAMVHGGVVAPATKVVAHGSLHMAHHVSDSKYTGSMRVNYLRPMRVGGSTRYTASPVQIGRGTAVMDSVAVGDDGRTSAVARVTSYL